MAVSENAIVVEQVFSHPRDKVWKAISEVEEMNQWFFEDVQEFKAEAGFETRFEIDLGERKFTHVWKITEAIPNSKIVYDWSYVEYPGTGIVTFELSEEPQGSLLRVTNEGLETFPADVPEFSRESCVEGWQYLIQESLKAHLSGIRLIN